MSDALSAITSANEQDFLIFNTIANPDKVDLAKHTVRVTKGGEAGQRSHSKPAHHSRSRSRTPLVDEIRASRSPSPSPSPTLSHVSSLGSLSSVGSSRRSSRSRRSRKSYSRSRSRSYSRTPSLYSRSSRGSRERYYSGRQTSLAEEIFRKGFSEKDPDVLREKRQYLENLDMKRRDDPTIRQFTLDDPLEEIEREFNRTYSSEAEKEGVEFMREVLKFSTSCIEGANQKYGPILKLRKWSSIIARDVDEPGSQYNEALCGVYRTYFAGRSRMNPLLQLGGLLGMSMLGHHWKMENNPSWEPLASQSVPGAPGAPPPNAPPNATPYNYPPSQYYQPPQPQYYQPPPQQQQQQQQHQQQQQQQPARPVFPKFPKPPPMQYGQGQ